MKVGMLEQRLEVSLRERSRWLQVLEHQVLQVSV